MPDKPLTWDSITSTVTPCTTTDSEEDELGDSSRRHTSRPCGLAAEQKEEL